MVACRHATGRRWGPGRYTCCGRPRMVYPQDSGVGVSSKLLAALTQVDSLQNCLPSLTYGADGAGGLGTELSAA